MGVNKLNSLMTEMTETAGISVKTNHSGRKTLVQKLQDNDVSPNQIVQITGHKIYHQSKRKTNGEHFENFAILIINNEYRTRVKNLHGIPRNSMED